MGYQLSTPESFVSREVITSKHGLKMSVPNYNFFTDDDNVNNSHNINDRYPASRLLNRKCDFIWEVVLVVGHN